MAQNTINAQIFNRPHDGDSFVPIAFRPAALEGGGRKGRRKNLPGRECDKSTGAGFRRHPNGQRSHGCSVARADVGTTLRRHVHQLIHIL